MADVADPPEIEPGELLTEQQSREIRAGLLVMGYDSLSDAARIMDLNYDMVQQMLSRSRAVSEKYAPHLRTWLQEVRS